MQTEFEVLKRVGDGLDAMALPFMLTGSFALAFYATPRMTRDIDLVVAVALEDVAGLLQNFSTEFYIDADDVRSAINNERLFNLMHFRSGIKIDVIVRKSSAYRIAEFARRQQVQLGEITTWIVSREDLILSKLEWSRISQSELQHRDVRQLLEGPCDVEYLRLWAPRLGLADALQKLLP